MGKGDQIERSPTGVPVARSIPLRGIARITAQVMMKSHLEYAELTGAREVDFTALLALRDRLRADLAAEGVRISITHLMLKAIAQALQAHPLLNATLVKDEIKILGEINIGLAVAREDGSLLVPVIRNVDRKSLLEVAREASALAERARRGLLRLEEMEGGTFTFSNFGVVGGDIATPLINPPQSAVLAMGRIMARPAVVDGEITVRQTAWLSLTCDHRIINGAQAALFGRTLEELVTEPSQLELGL